MRAPVQWSFGFVICACLNPGAIVHTGFQDLLTWHRTAGPDSNVEQIFRSKLYSRCLWIYAYTRTPSTCIDIYIYICTYIHPSIHPSMHPCIHASMHTCIHAYMHTCIHAYMHTCIHAYMHTRMHVNININTCVYTYTHIYRE